MIQRHPVLATVLSTGIILALAAPALGMKLNFPDESSQARGTMGYASYATMMRGFGPGFDAPVIAAAALPEPGATLCGRMHGGWVLPADTAPPGGHRTTVGACANPGHFRSPTGQPAATACPASTTS